MVVSADHCGHIPDNKILRMIISHVMCVIICVDFLQTKYQAKNYEAQSTEAVKELDSVLTQLVVSYSYSPVRDTEY